MSKPSPPSAAKAIDFPSGDHAGSRSTAAAPSCKARPFLPAGEEMKMRSRYEVASRLPSGDQAGSWTPAEPGDCAPSDRTAIKTKTPGATRRANEAGLKACATTELINQPLVPSP